jgi:predicted nucleotide-binding protein
LARKPASTSQPPKPPLELNITQEDARTRLQDRIEKGLELKKRQIGSSQEFDALDHDYDKWDSFNTELLKRLFTSDELSKEYSSWGFIGMSPPSLREKIADLYENIDDKIRRIDSIIERLELIPVSSTHATLAAQREDAEAQPRSKKVFVVHGRDEVAKTNLEIFLREIGLEPVVLHRQADEGLTIIEKFEKHSDVGYAFILLTPDEVAYLVSEEGKPDAERRKEFRARPNVIFEFGYFVGKLGRSCVCCLYTGDVALPSDVSGMIYKKYHKGIEEVAYSITKDLRAAGYSIA